MKISVLLPYKENFTVNSAGAVSLFVNDTCNESIYQDSTYIFGNTIYKNKLSKNYINLNLDRNIFQSTSKKYVESFLEFQKDIKTDLIEIHNRPNYIKQIRKKFDKKIFLYFHNDPLTMQGSKTKSERLFLLSNLDKILFNSNWSKDRFFIDFKNTEILEEKIDVCFQSSSKVKINFKNKQKLISFVGKLNNAKGYDLFGQTIIKILEKHNDWKANVYGDEPREKITFNHKNLKIFGFKSNDFILNDLKKISISVVCSRWNEPFGRTSLEAASRGSAVIISNKGGLPETTPNAIKLKMLTSTCLFDEIDGLINDKKKLLSIQKKNYQNFKYTHKYISNLIDNIRKSLIRDNQKNVFNIKKNTVLKLIHVTNFNERFNGRLHYNTGRRLNNGFIRLGHNVMTISDRDIIHNNKNLMDVNGKKKLQKYLLDSLKNFKADAIILGHADSVANETLAEIKDKNKNLKICQWFLDPIGKDGPDHFKNTSRIFDKEEFIDTSFLTTDPSVLSRKLNNSFYIPNPSDKSFEILKAYEKKNENDLFFAMSHGVHRGQLKSGKSDDRESFINRLIKKNKDIIFDIYGMNKAQPVWGDDFLGKILKSSMGLNLSRGAPVKYYSSDRLTQLMGNGLLTFIHKKTFLDNFFNKKQAVFYDDIDDLSYKINKFKKDSKNRIIIAKNGRDFYLKKFNSTLVADFILSKTFDYKSKNKFIWSK
jgi:glycosyltransferase involved in cell wall biosynthesis